MLRIWLCVPIVMQTRRCVIRISRRSHSRLSDVLGAAVFFYYVRPRPRWVAAAVIAAHAILALATYRVYVIFEALFYEGAGPFVT